MTISPVYCYFCVHGKVPPIPKRCLVVRVEADKIVKILEGGSQRVELVSNLE